MTSRPLLPAAAEILPFLQQIETNRWYTNFGPLVTRFEAELARVFDAADGSVVTASSATAAITLALQDCTGARQGLCIVPSWTFVATPIAVRNANLTPLFVDVDETSWLLTPEIAREALRRHKTEVRAIVVVAPFGLPVNYAAWTAFFDETGLPVIVDAASGFDTAKAHPDIVSIVSLHATKPLGIGEGAFILACAAKRAERLRRMTNFGMNANRESFMVGANAKLSEYSAAVGLVALREWPQRRAALLAQAGKLRRMVDAHTNLRCFGDAHVASSTFSVVSPEGRAAELIDWLNLHGIEGRRWWGRGCHAQAAFEAYPREALATTERLADAVVGLPFFVDMSADDIAAIVDCLKSFETADLGRGDTNAGQCSKMPKQAWQ